VLPVGELMPAIQETLYGGYIAERERKSIWVWEVILSLCWKSPNHYQLNSGTAALHIALLSAGVGPGDEVISTVLTAEPMLP
jgi:dTDP-4-amino-4,6-dideoxygalactose transaminase